MLHEHRRARRSPTSGSSSRHRARRRRPAGHGRPPDGGDRHRRHRRGHPRDLPRRSTTPIRSPAATPSRSPAPGLERPLRTPAHFARAVGQHGRRSRRMPGRRGRPAGRRACSRPPTTTGIEVPSTTTAGASDARATTRSSGPAPCSSGARAEAGQGPAPKHADATAEGRQSNEQPRHDGGAAGCSPPRRASRSTRCSALADALESPTSACPDAYEYAVGHDRPRQRSRSGSSPRSSTRTASRRSRVDVTPERLRPHRRADGQAGDDPAHPRGRARA